MNVRMDWRRAPVIVATMALAGLVYAGLWAFAPIAVADISSMIVVIAALCVMAGYSGWAVLSCRNARTAD